LVEPLLIVRRVLHEQIDILHRRLLAVVRNDDVSIRQAESAFDHVAPREDAALWCRNHLPAI
jgi:hypothetical protein